jgi:small-conductance mechanosensitive channel
VATRYAALSKDQLRVADLWFLVFVIVSVTLTLSSLAVRALRYYGERQDMPFAAAGLSSALIRVLILSLGAMALMRYLGIAITPMLTALGVGGLAVALALQDTLANFFAGVHILVETPIRVGDFIRLSTGEEGVVADIGWRTTRIRALANNMIVIPNTRITSGNLTNFNLPDARVATEVIVVVAQDADPDRVVQLAKETASTIEGVLVDPPPAVVFDPGITPTHMQFKVVIHVPGPLAQGPARSDLRLALLNRFRQEGIDLPRVDWEAAQRAEPVA